MPTITIPANKGGRFVKKENVSVFEFVFGLSCITFEVVHDKKFNIRIKPIARIISIAILPFFIKKKMKKRLYSFWIGF